MIIDVSVIIINYNTFKLTCKCIESVIRYTSNINYEIILVDNASTEKDPKEFQRLFPQIILVKSEVNAGFAKGNNIGIKIARGHTLLLLNSDAEVVDNVIGELYIKLQGLQEVGVITCKLVYPDGRIQHQCGKLPSIFLQIIELFRLQKLMSKRKREELLLGGFFDQSRSVYPDWIWGTFFMFKRSILNYFPEQKLTESYFLYMEDMEWCYNIIKGGGKIYFDSSLSIVHHAGSSTKNFFKKNLNPTIEGNFRDLVKRQKGVVYAWLFFAILDLNRTLAKY